jgi:hypothetical protein
MKLRQLCDGRGYFVLLRDIAVFDLAHGNASAVGPTVSKKDSLLARGEAGGGDGGNGDHLAAQISQHRIDVQRAIEAHHHQLVAGRNIGNGRTAMFHNSSAENETR